MPDNDNIIVETDSGWVILRDNYGFIVAKHSVVKKGNRAGEKTVTGRTFHGSLIDALRKVVEETTDLSLAESLDELVERQEAALRKLAAQLEAK